MPFDPATADPAELAQWIAAAGVAILCVGGTLLLAGMLLVGMAVLRREGKQVTVQRSLRRGAKTVTLFFERKEGVSEPWTDHGEDPPDDGGR